MIEGGLAARVEKLVPDGHEGRLPDEAMIKALEDAVEALDEGLSERAPWVAIADRTGAPPEVVRPFRPTHYTVNLACPGRGHPISCDAGHVRSQG